MANQSTSRTNNELKNEAAEPYRRLFPIGTLAAIVGVGLWLAHAASWINYPRSAHAGSMTIGFLTTFVAGFLMTAVPRFTGTPSASGREIQAAMVLAFGGLGVSLFLSDTWFFDAWVILFYGFLLAFGFRRFFKRTNDPPESFVFLPAGVFLAIAGSTFSLLVYPA